MSRALVLSMVFAVSACGPSVPVSVAPPGSAPVGASAARSGAVDVAGLKSDLERGHVALLVDVREPSEYAGGHIPSAINIPLGELEARAGEIEGYKGAPVYVVCESGRRSLGAQNILEKRGYDVVNVEEGTRAWRSAGYATE